MVEHENDLINYLKRNLNDACTLIAELTVENKLLKAKLSGIKDPKPQKVNKRELFPNSRDLLQRESPSREVSKQIPSEPKR